jgi:hypothetical protein
MPISERRDLNHLSNVISGAELHHHGGGRHRVTNSVFHFSLILLRSRAGRTSIYTTTKPIAHECVQKRLKKIPGSAKLPVAPDAVEGNNANVCENGVAPPPILEDQGAEKKTTNR